MTPDELVATACPLIGKLGGSFYFVPETLARGKEQNLDGMRFYYLGRAGVLGDVEAKVVQSALGYFAPGLVAKMWTTAKERMAPRAAARSYFECCAEHGRRTLAGVDGLDAYCEAAATVVEAAEPASYALFAGLSVEPLVDDVTGRALQLTAVLREYRGGAHLAAVMASGLSPAVAHAIRRPGDVQTFGYAEAPPVTDADRAKLAAADTLTDAMVLDAFATLDPAAAEAMVSGLTAMDAAMGAASA